MMESVCVEQEEIKDLSENEIEEYDVGSDWGMMTDLGLR